MIEEEETKLSAETLMKCARRELDMRERVYPRMVEMGRMPADKADHEIACMRAIVGVLKQKVRDESDQMYLF